MSDTQLTDRIGLNRVSIASGRLSAGQCLQLKCRFRPGVGSRDEYSIGVSARFDELAYESLYGNTLRRRVVNSVIDQSIEHAGLAAELVEAERRSPFGRLSKLPFVVKCIARTVK